MLPVTVALKDCWLPARIVAVAGDTCTLIAALFTTCAINPPEETAPGSGFFTVMEMLPTWPVVAVPLAVNCVEDTRVVASAVAPK